MGARTQKKWPQGWLEARGGPQGGGPNGGGPKPRKNGAPNGAGVQNLVFFPFPHRFRYLFFSRGSSRGIVAPGRHRPPKLCPKAAGVSQNNLESRPLSGPADEGVRSCPVPTEGGEGGPIWSSVGGGPVGGARSGRGSGGKGGPEKRDRGGANGPNNKRWSEWDSPKWN